ncbi:MAG: YibE/F family protein [Chloroflexota bacterium]|nr:YibE/F family protein [Chloroflexota bacterium]
MAQRTLILLAILAAVLSSCSDLNVGTTGAVEDAHVARVLETGERRVAGRTQPFQRLALQLDSGLYRGDEVTVQWGGRTALNASGLLREGDRVLVSVTRDANSARTYTIQEIVRLPALAPIAGLLAAALLVVARLKGVASLAGLAGSVGVFLLVIVPSLRRGEDPLAAVLVGSLAVLLVAVFVVHGFNRKSIAALVGSATSLGAVAGIAAVALPAAHITGLGSEEAVFLAVATSIDLSRLVFAGVLLASLGALVDMAVGQASATFEIASIDRELGRQGLYASALNVGRDHIGSLVNTLALAYFGGTLPLLLLLSLGNAPLSLALNSETVAGSVISVLIASVGLVVCVPITTVVAVMLARR